VVRGGFGIFYERVGEDLTLQADRFDGQSQLQYLVTSPEVLDTEVDAARHLAERVNAPNDCRDVALLAIQAREVVHTCYADAESTLTVLERADAFRRPDRLDRLLEVAECDTHVESPESFGPRRQLARALEAARSVDAGKIAKESPGDVADAIRRARLVAIASLQPATGF